MCQTRHIQIMMQVSRESGSEGSLGQQKTRELRETAWRLKDRGDLTRDETDGTCLFGVEWRILPVSFHDRVSCRASCARMRE